MTGNEIEVAYNRAERDGGHLAGLRAVADAAAAEQRERDAKIAEGKQSKGIPMGVVTLNGIPTELVYKSTLDACQCVGLEIAAAIRSTVIEEEHHG